MPNTVALALTSPDEEKDVSLVSPHRDPGLSTVEALRRTLGLSAT
jgi:hypothetical protein